MRRDWSARRRAATRTPLPRTRPGAHPRRAGSRRPAGSAWPGRSRAPRGTPRRPPRRSRPLGVRDDRAHLDRPVPRALEPRSHRDRRVAIRALDEVVAGEELLRHRVRTVGDLDLPVAHAHRRRGIRATQPLDVEQDPLLAQPAVQLEQQRRHRRLLVHLLLVAHEHVLRHLRKFYARSGRSARTRVPAPAAPSIHGAAETLHAPELAAEVVREPPQLVNEDRAPADTGDGLAFLREWRRVQTQGAIDRHRRGGLAASPTWCVRGPRTYAAANSSRRAPMPTPVQRSSPVTTRSAL